MYNPKVSIIIPVYNGANYIEEAIECALNQTYQNTEIIVVNDGSTDNGKTDAAVRKYLDRIVYIQKENGGVSSALNLAIEQMQGEWFSWLSHDDRYYPEKVQEEVAAVEAVAEREELPKEKIVIYCNNERIDKDGNVILRRKLEYNNENGCKELVLNNIHKYIICGCAVLVHRSALLEVGGFNEKIRTVSDAECFYKLLFANYRFFFLDRVLVQSRQHRNQVGKKKAALFQEEGDRLHVWILQEFLKREEWVTDKSLLYFIAGVAKRGFPKATESAVDEYYVRYGRKNMLKVIGTIAKYTAVRRCRNALRWCYRKIVVK